MKAQLRSVRIAPKKANLIAKMIRGMSVSDAIASLEKTNKKSARLLQDLVNSAVANAKHNDNQDPETLVIKSLVVNKAQAYYRGIPIARGRQRPIRKFLSHITLTLGVKEAPKAEKPASAPASAPSASSSGPRGKATAGKKATEDKEAKESKEAKEKKSKPAAKKAAKTAKTTSQTAKKPVKKASTSKKPQGAPKKTTSKTPKKSETKGSASEPSEPSSVS